MTPLKIITASFPAAIDNMTYDHQLLSKFNINPNLHIPPHFRCYLWPQPSLTYSFKQELPSLLLPFDHAKRITGGGIVFHNPHDLTFSLCALLTDPLFAKGIKNKMSFIQAIVHSILAEFNLENDSAVVTNPNIAYCNTYPNPFEIYVQGQKILGLTIKKSKYAFLIQGIIHTSSNFKWFYYLPKEFHAYFTHGLNNINPQTLQKKLIATIKTNLATPYKA
jgi:lipoate-protein ligase A